MKSKLTFTQSVKEEICENDFTNLQYLDVLSGFIMTNATYVEEEDKRKIVLATENAKIAKLIFKALNQTFNVTPLFTYQKKMKLDKCVVYHITISDKIDEILSYLELVDEEGYPTYPRAILDDTEKIRAFLSGVFLASGSVNSPNSSNYHLQMVVPSPDDAKYIIKLTNKFKNDKSMDFKSLSRRNKGVVYLKKADQIACFLAVAYASNSMMEFEDARIRKDFINSDNRYQICVTANYQKTLAKSTEQINDINIIEKKYGLIHLNEKEQLVAKARLNNPEAPLSEIALIVKNENPNISISKSGVNRIFTSFHDLAISLKRQ